MAEVAPEIIQAMLRFRAGLARRDAALLRTLTARWVELERALEGAIAALAEEAARRAAAGEAVSRSMVQRWGRYERLLSQVQAEMARYADDGALLIGREQREVFALGIEHAEKALGLLEPRLIGAFDVLPVAAFENLVGLVSDGSPLRTYLLRTYPQAAQAMIDALIQGMGQGWGAVKIARAMQAAAAIGLRHAMNTARTETLRAYRQASLEEYRQSQVVEGYIRLAAKSDRTCAGCLLMDGQWFPLETPFAEHVNGRCTPVPQLAGSGGRGASVPWQTGREWFETLPGSRQQEILGPGLFRAWQDGQIGLDEIPVLHEDPVWGNAWAPARVPK